MLRIYLDFDGVIADSAMECVSSAYSVWSALNAGFDEQNLATMTQSKRQQIINLALEYRFLVIPPEHYFCLIQAAFETVQTSSVVASDGEMINKFKDICEHVPSLILDQFKEALFHFRENLFSQKSDLEWVNDNPPTPFSESLFEMLELVPADVYIVSRKNYKALAKWVSGAKIDVKGIYGNEDLRLYEGSKFRLISSVQNELGGSGAVFVDDMAFELDSVGWSGIGVRTLHAGWGYNSAHDNTIEVLEEIRALIE